MATYTLHDALPASSPEDLLALEWAGSKEVLLKLLREERLAQALSSQRARFLFISAIKGPTQAVFNSNAQGAGRKTGSRHLYPTFLSKLRM